MGEQSVCASTLEYAISGIRVKKISTQDGETTVVFDYPTRLRKLKTYQLIASAGGLRLKLVCSRSI